jgi:hypothetical protein
MHRRTLEENVSLNKSLPILSVMLLAAVPAAALQYPVVDTG